MVFNADRGKTIRKNEDHREMDCSEVRENGKVWVSQQKKRMLSGFAKPGSECPSHRKIEGGTTYLVKGGKRQGARAGPVVAREDRRETKIHSGWEEEKTSYEEIPRKPAKT